jgi:prepilin-type N-terminal cleavage/methylation domain-containing protein
MTAPSIFLLASDRRRRLPRAFTLIEIMVVVAIIVILVGITVAVGTQVKRTAQRKNTLVELQALSGYMDQYLSQGNPEPTVTTPWPYPAGNPQFAPTKDSSGTVPGSDVANWVKNLRASPLGTKLSAYPMDKDPLNNPTLLDKYGTPIRYIPSNPATKAKGYFQSAGPDGIFSNTSPVPTPVPQQDDIFSTDAM